MEEHGLIMDQPDLPDPPGKYLVTGDREVVTVLTVHPADKDGATLSDMTRLPWRSAHYTPVTRENSCSLLLWKTDFR